MIPTVFAVPVILRIQILGVGDPRQVAAEVVVNLTTQNNLWVCVREKEMEKEKWKRGWKWKSSNIKTTLGLKI